MTTERAARGRLQNAKQTTSRYVYEQGRQNASERPGPWGQRPASRLVASLFSCQSVSPSNEENDELSCGLPLAAPDSPRSPRRPADDQPTTSQLIGTRVRGDCRWPRTSYTICKSSSTHTRGNGWVAGNRGKVFRVMYVLGTCES